MKDEHDRFQSFINDLRTTCGGSKDDAAEWVNNFEGSLDECVIFYKLHRKSK
jgi:hypothetical protein